MAGGSATQSPRRVKSKRTLDFTDGYEYNFISVKFGANIIRAEALQLWQKLKKGGVVTVRIQSA